MGSLFFLKPTNVLQNLLHGMVQSIFLNQIPKNFLTLKQILTPSKHVLVNQIFLFFLPKFVFEDTLVIHSELAVPKKMVFFDKTPEL